MILSACLQVGFIFAFSRHMAREQIILIQPRGADSKLVTIFVKAGPFLNHPYAWVVTPQLPQSKA